MVEDLASVPGGVGRTPTLGLERSVRRWIFRFSQKMGPAVEKTKMGKGTKWMVVADGKGFPLGSALASASPAEVQLVEETFKAIVVPRQGPGRPLQNPERLARCGIELIVPHRQNRIKPPTQDGQPLRRYQRRWKIERLLAWLGNFRRLVTRYERLLVTYLSFFHVACARIVLRNL